MVATVAVMALPDAIKLATLNRTVLSVHALPGPVGCRGGRGTSSSDGVQGDGAIRSGAGRPLQAGDLIFKLDDLFRPRLRPGIGLRAAPPAARDRARSTRQPSGYCIRTYWAVVLMASMLSHPLAGSPPMVESQPQHVRRHGLAGFEGAGRLAYLG